MAIASGKKGQEAIRAVTQRLVEAYKPERIILFGSYCHSQATEDSDIDLLIIKDTPEGFFERLATVRGVVAGLHRGIPFDPIVLTPEEVSERVAGGDQFIEAILKDGQVLHAA